MRFCMITTFYPPHHFGGDAIFVYRLAHLLGDAGHEVDVYYNQDAFTVLSEQKEAPGYPEHERVRRVPLSSGLPMVDVLRVQQTGRPWAHRGALKAAIEDGNYDAVHFHNVSLAGAPSVLSWRPKNGAPTLMTIHEHWLVCPMHVLWKYDRGPCDERECLRCQLHGKRPPQLWRYTGARDRGVNGLDRLLAPSLFTQNKHRELGMLRPTEFLPHFVPELPQSHETKLGGDALKPPYFAFVGRLERLKGAHTLIDAFLRAPELNLVLAGDGGQREELERQAGGAPNIRFLGRVAPGDLGRVYGGATAAIIPSLCFEVFGLTAVEALSCGTPIVVRNRGPLPEIVEQSGAGFAYDDEDQLLGHLRRLARDETALASLKQGARESYLANWTGQRHLDRYLSIVEEASAESRRRSGAR